MLPSATGSAGPPGKAVAVLLALAGLGWGMLAVVSHRFDQVSIWLLLVTLACEWAILLLLLGRASFRAALNLRTIWIAAIAFRLCGVPATPILEEDHHRFLWDGFVFAQTGNPYATAPADWFADARVPDPFQAVLDQVNHPDVPTIYGPLTQTGFLASHLVAPAALWPWKLLLLLADLALLFMLPRIAGGPMAIHAAAFVALCPLSIFETAFNAHPDALGVALLAGALLARTAGRGIWLGALCGAAVAAKMFAVLLVPFLLWRRSRSAWLAGALTVLACYLPFWLQGTTADLAGLRAFARDWEFNSSGYALLAWWLGPAPARVTAALLFVALWLAAFVHASRLTDHATLLPPGLFIFAAFFLLSPVFNPWYALWLLPFVALRPTPAGITLLAAVSLSYLTEHNLGRVVLDGFAHPGWVRPLEFGLVGFAFSFELRHRWLTRTKPATAFMT